MGGVGRTAAGVAAALLLAAGAAAQDLEVAGSGPSGALSDREQAREVRVVFSEPMVALGRIPKDVPAPFFRITPSVPGRFRWSGTRTLIFTPAAPLPFGTRYEVTVEGAVALSGRRLARAHRFSFTTPTLRLLRASWYRQTRRYDSRVVLLLRFNQPVARARLAGHLQVAYQPHEWTPPVLPPEGLALLAPADVSGFQAKVARVEGAVRASSEVPVAAARTWDQKAFPPADDLLVLVTEGTPPTDAWLRVRLAAGARGAQGDQGAGEPQETTVKLEPTFFAEGFRCRQGCDPDHYNPLRLRSTVEASALGRALGVKDVTDPARPARVPRRTKPAPPEDAEAGALAAVAAAEEYGDALDRSTDIALEDAGF
ncbi:MAG TPA: Ig-like domain-containing protein, partial [Vicinamibacteria bacterium]